MAERFAFARWTGSAGTMAAFALAAIVACASLGSAYAFFHDGALHEIFRPERDRMLVATAAALVTFGLSLTTLRVRRAQDALRENALRGDHEHAAHLERANAALTETNRTLEAFTYVVSHDLKEPARALGELTTILRDDHGGALNAERKDLLARAAEASLRLETLLAGLLDYSRATQIQPHEIQVVHVDEVLRHAECLTRYERALTERGGRLGVTPGPPVRASMTGMCQIVGNLVLNSLKHRPDGHALVRVESSPTLDDVTMVDVIVEDNGPGYPPLLVEQFNAARRGRPTTLRGGFGLIIAREASEKMGGRMSIRNASGGGARTIITLPAASAA